MGVYINIDVKEIRHGAVAVLNIDDVAFFVKGKDIIAVPDHGDLMDRDKFVAEKREQFCADCSNRKSLKTGRFVYEIGDCVCRACDIDDMLDYIEDAPVVIQAERSEKANGGSKEDSREEDENWYTELDDPKIAERSENGES